MHLWMENTDDFVFEELSGMSWLDIHGYQWFSLGLAVGRTFLRLVIAGRSCRASWPSLRHGGSSVAWAVNKLSHDIRESHWNLYCINA